MCSSQHSEHGTPETVAEFSRDAVSECFDEWYAPNRVVITAAENLDHARLVDLVAQEFGGAARSSIVSMPTPPNTHACVEQRAEKIEQVHIVLGVPSYPLAHERRYAASLLNVILGGGMSSRLFQNIRERQGLAYAIESDLSPYTDSGVLSVYAGISRESAVQLIRSVCDEFRAVRRDGVSVEELRRAKDHLKGSMMLSLDSRARACPISRASHVPAPVYFARRNAGVDRSGDARGSARHRARFLRAGPHYPHRARQLEWLSGHARSAGMTLFAPQWPLSLFSGATHNRERSRLSTP